MMPISIQLRKSYNNAKTRLESFPGWMNLTAWPFLNFTSCELIYEKNGYAVLNWTYSRCLTTDPLFESKSYSLFSFFFVFNLLSWQILVKSLAVIHLSDISWISFFLSSFILFISSSNDSGRGERKLRMGFCLTVFLLVYIYYFFTLIYFLRKI